MPPSPMGDGLLLRFFSGALIGRWGQVSLNESYLMKCGYSGTSKVLATVAADKAAVSRNAGHGSVGSDLSPSELKEAYSEFMGSCARAAVKVVTNRYVWIALHTNARPSGPRCEAHARRPPPARYTPHGEGESLMIRSISLKAHGQCN